MAIQFEQPLTAGTVLVRSDIRSQNFVQGSAGWRIEANGNAEFNSVIIRGGTVVSGLALYYNGTPAAGNLIMSIAAAAGTDSFGNAYVKGLGLYGASGQVVAKDAAGDTAILSGNVGGGGLLAALPGLAMQPVFNAGGDPATIGALDPGTHTDFSLLLTSPSAVVGGIPGSDFSQINMVGKYGGPPEINMAAGNITLNGSILDADGAFSTYANDIWNTYTPSMTNAGSATFSTRTGWYLKIGTIVFFAAYFVCNGAGSGASAINVSTPSAVDRTTRQAVHAHVSGVAGPGTGEYTGLCLNGGSGAVIDRITRGGTDLTGANVSNGAIFTIQGWYRQQ